MAKDIGIDLGTASVLVFVRGKGIVLNEPSVVALDKNTGKLLKVGEEAQAMLGRTPGNIIAIRPLREGVISDYDMTERMLREFIHKVAGVSVFKPRVIICVPSGITEVEERAVIDAGISAGARKVYLIEEPVAAAIGAGIDIAKPDGHMVVDIGGGTADIAVISLGGVVESASIKIAGDQLNEAVVKYMRRKHNLLVGERTAEEMKKRIGCVFPKDEEEIMDVKGRCLLTGLPKVVAKCNRQNYTSIANSVGLESIISPKLITAENILHVVRGMQNSHGSVMNALYRIADGKAEAMEFIVSPSTRNLGVPLKDLRLKPGILIAVIVRKGKIIIPEGSTFIQEKDSVILISRNSGILDLNDIYASADQPAAGTGGKA